MPKTVKIGAAASLAILLLFLFLFGGTFLRRVTLGKGNDLDTRGEPHWKLLFLQQYAFTFKSLDRFQAHDPHPVLGWVPKPNLRGKVSTNNRGQRSLADYRRQPEKYVVAIYGDSFTFGADAVDEDVWPTVLQGFDDRFQVINLGVDAYGLDQMYLMLRESLDEYKPNLAVFAPYSDDFNRSLLAFRDCPKPRFILNESGELDLIGVPIPNRSEFFHDLRAKYGYWRPRAALDAENAAFMKTIQDGSYDKEWTALNRKIIEDTVACALEKGAGMLLTHLAGNIEIAANAKPSDHFAAEDLLEEVARAKQVPFVSTRLAFVETPGKWVDGHYQGPEARLVARVIRDAIYKTDSWKRFEEN